MAIPLLPRAWTYSDSYFFSIYVSVGLLAVVTGGRAGHSRLVFELSMPGLRSRNTPELISNGDLEHVHDFLES